MISHSYWQIKARPFCIVFWSMLFFLFLASQAAAQFTYPNSDVFIIDVGHLPLYGLSLSPYFYNYIYGPGPFTPYDTRPAPNFSNWIWTDPWTAYNPNPLSEGGVAVAVNWLPEAIWTSPYFQQIGYPFGYPASPFPWPTNLPGVSHPLAAIFHWPWNQAFNAWPVSWGQWSPYYQGGNPYGDGLYSPLGAPPSSYDPYGPMFMPGVGWINPYQTIPNPFSITGFSMYIPDWGLWPPSMGGYDPVSGTFWWGPRYL